MTTTAESLVDLVVAAMLGRTAAGADVQAYRDWGIQTNAGVFSPKITVDLPDEDKDGLGSAGPATFDTTAIITVHGFVSAISAAAPGGDGGEVRVRQAVTALRRQIEVAVINDAALMGEISRIKAVRSKMSATGDGNGVHVAEAVLQFAFVFYQGPEDFAPVQADEVDDMRIDVKPLDPAGVDLRLDIPLT